MRRVTQFLPTTILIALGVVALAGCHGSAEVRYVNRTNTKEVLTLRHTTTVKTQIIQTFHGISAGSYTLKTDGGTASGTFTGDRGGFKFKSEDGKTESVKINSDGSFDFAQGTWALGSLDKTLKAVASSKEGVAQ